MFEPTRGLILLAGFLAAEQVLQAGEWEQREYSVFIDGKEAGLTTIEINQQDDGLTCVTTRANVKVHKLIFQYNLTIESTEWWRDGRLVALKSHTQENSKSTNIDVAAERSTAAGPHQRPGTQSAQRGMDVDLLETARRQVSQQRLAPLRDRHRQGVQGPIAIRGDRTIDGHGQTAVMLPFPLQRRGDADRRLVRHAVPPRPSGICGNGTPHHWAAYSSNEKVRCRLRRSD